MFWISVQNYVMIFHGSELNSLLTVAKIFTTGKRLNWILLIFIGCISRFYTWRLSGFPCQPTAPCMLAGIWLASAILRLSGVPGLASHASQNLFQLASWPCRGKLTSFLNFIILLTSSKNQIYEFRIPNIYNYFFNNIQLMYTLCFLVASVKLKVYKKVVKFSFKQ